MLIILMIFLIISSIMVLLVKRNKESFYIFGMCISLAIMLTGILLYIAKKGGISRELQDFLYFNNNIKISIQYFVITLGQMGYIIAIGRYLFPMFLLLLSLHYSMIPLFQRNYWIKRVIVFIPIFTLILYYPTIFFGITNLNENIQRIITYGTVIWIVSFIIFSTFLLFYEAHSIVIRFFKKKFILITSFVMSLCIFYFLYFGQDPAQVYSFYSYENGIYYLKNVLSVPAYILLIVLNVIFGIIGFTSIIKYTREIFESSREEITIQRKFDAISTGTSVFVHSIKNQLLSNRVLFKRLKSTMESNVDVDVEKLKELTESLSKQNENILTRIEELYRAVKSNVVHLVPVDIHVILINSLDRFYQKFPDIKVDFEFSTTSNVLADKVHLSEAVYNLLINAQEAVSALHENGEINLHCYDSRQFTVIEVKDNGIGISKNEAKKIFEPYYSKKNSNSNWGMGLHYVRMIVKEHFGSIRFESEVNKGSSFYILLPKYKG
ncbi:ATP-binding protein [Fredinandcohnia sp. FSL W7-1320]|uniref:ATP-binding protein n=1 Tax=Fredinandcohnia sp. FSL W7-1320 TaxID=2954540 RepID=UPI0030FD848E